MARRVFFSFHYKDIFLVSQIRNSWRITQNGEAQKFYDHAEWEKLKRSNPASVTNWINTQISGSSVTVVLIGSETSTRKWVIKEIEKTIELKHGMLGVYMYGMKSPVNQLLSTKGANPFNRTLTRTGKPLSSYFKTYDWVKDNGYKNLGTWVENAINAPKP
jgi:hypothetical protein